jgi:hypothetical protein
MSGTVKGKIIYKTISLKALIAADKAKLFPLTLDREDGRASDKRK